MRNVECKKEYFLQNVLALCITFLYVLNKYYILDFERLKLEEKLVMIDPRGPKEEAEPSSSPDHTQ